VIRELLEGGVP